jgi:hypothetical protein
MQPTLLILAAGMASRYGSMKQTQGFGPSGETIMDYSIYDAIRAGFGKVVFIIRKDFADDFKATFEPKLKGKIETAYVYQEMDTALPAGFGIPEGRTKPWGTGHAVLCAKNEVHEPFAVINADDFYGADAFSKAYHFLVNGCSEKLYAIIGYQLDKTLSEHGTVSRGVCEVNDQNDLISIQERTKIYKASQGIVYEENQVTYPVSNEASVSMNFWCFHPEIFKSSETLFHDFVEKNSDNLKSEFFIPIVAQHFMEHLNGNIKVIPTSAQWFGVTYKEDAPGVKLSIDQLINDKAYPENLWNI